MDHGPGSTCSATARFAAVREMPYCTNGAVDAAGLRRSGRGSCVAKAQLLSDELTACGLATRLVSWEYTLPLLVDVQAELAFTSDVHTAVEVQAGGSWTLVDATHDSALAPLGLAVGTWEGGSRPTAPAYPPHGAVVRHGSVDAAHRLDEMRTRIGRQVAQTPPALVAEYQRQLNALLDRARC